MLHLMLEQYVNNQASTLSEAFIHTCEVAMLLCVLNDEEVVRISLDLE